MIPLQLSIEGIYSYQGRQKIDFEHLTRAGLFGIFGAVGSGKSSILEVISYAIFGETERLHARDKRAYNMMNLKSKRSYIEFDFLNFENRKIRVTREFKRNSKNFDDVKAVNINFYEWEDSSWIPLDVNSSKEIENLVGLSYMNFKRTTIIPQGQFKEFIELKEKDRTEMMKEIFNLSHFDLAEKTKHLVDKNKEEFNFIEGQIKSYDEITEEIIFLKENELDEEREYLLNIESQFEVIGREYNTAKSLKADFEILQQKKIEFEKLSIEKGNFDTLEKRILEYEKVEKVFRPLFLENQRLQQDFKTNSADRSHEFELVKENQRKYDLNKRELIKIQPEFDQLEKNKSTAADLEVIFKILNYETEISALKINTKKGKQEIEDHERKLSEIQNEILLLNTKTEELQVKKLDSEILFLVGNWFAKKKNMVESGTTIKKRISSIKKEIDKTDSELQALVHHDLDYKNNFEKEIIELQTQNKTFENEKINLEIQQKLAMFASELHDGRPCLLCGSTDHPHILNEEDNSEALKKLDIKKQNIDQNLKNIQLKIISADKICDKKVLFLNQLKTENEQLEELKLQYRKHQKDFIWKDFNREDESSFSTKKNDSLLIEKQIMQLNAALKISQKSFEKQQISYKETSKMLQDLVIDEVKKGEQIKSSIQQLRILSYDDYKNHKIENIKEQAENLNEKNRETEKNHLRFSVAVTELEPKIAAQLATIENIGKRISEVEEYLKQNTDDIARKLEEHHFKNIGETEEILSQKLDVENVKKKISDFKIKYEILKNSIEELQAKFKDTVFDSKEFDRLEMQFQSIDIQVTSLSNAVFKYNNEILRLKEEYAKKEIILRKFLTVQTRADNLKIMTNLFKGAGFVQYISSIYLSRLCDQANVRFNKMTRNQLSLQLNAENNFEIIDYLNEGRCRSVKTLSGGQAFQVSLSLALALAETVQSKTITEKNFFFIDEGFGTQDADSVNTVFETLMDLQKENRIVGIISHVEELKEKMPVSLQITKDMEKGSVITYN